MVTTAAASSLLPWIEMQALNPLRGYSITVHAFLSRFGTTYAMCVIFVKSRVLGIFKWGNVRVQTDHASASIMAFTLPITAGNCFGEKHINMLCMAAIKYKNQNEALIAHRNTSPCVCNVCVIVHNMCNHAWAINKELDLIAPGCSHSTSISLFQLCSLYFGKCKVLDKI